MRPLLILAPLALLAACGTPQERCIQRETRDLRVLDRLITETRTNIGRGYALQEYTVSVPQWETCPPRTDANGNLLPAQMCLEDRTETRTRPVAIDLGAENAKLESMLAKRDQLARESEGRIAMCRTTYPE
jgi:hypothetical protein